MKKGPPPLPFYTYTHSIDMWMMNGACMGHHIILMCSMLTMHLGHYRSHKKHHIKEFKRNGIPLSMPLPAIDVEALLIDDEENLKLEQIRGTHLGIMDLLGDLGSPLYAELLSMMEHFDAMIVSAHHLGDLPKQGHCKDMQMTIQLYQDEAHHVTQKILSCLDMSVLDGDLVMQMCLHTPTLILPHRCFIQLYFDPDNQGRYASRFLSGGQGFLQL